MKSKKLLLALSLAILPYNLISTPVYAEEKSVYLDNNKEKCQRIIDAKLDELNQLKRLAEKENNNENKKAFEVESKLIELTLFVQQLEETEFFSRDIVNNFYEKCLGLNSLNKIEGQNSKKKQNTLSLEELERELTELKQQFTSISHSLTLEVLAEPSVIISLRENLTSLLISYHSLHPNQTEYDFLWPELAKRIKKVIVDTIKNLTIKPNLATVKRVEEICTSFGLEEEKELLPEVYHAYEKGSYKNRKLLKYHIQSVVKYFNKWGWLFDKKRRIANKKCLAQFL